MNADLAFERIAEMISYTNNGKLMIARIPPELRKFIPELRADGRLSPAMFMQASDSVRL